MQSPPSRPPWHRTPLRAAGYDRAKTLRETIVTRLPLQPPAKTPRPVLVRPLPRAEATPETGCRATVGASLVRSRIEPAPRRATTPAPVSRRATTPAPVSRRATTPAPAASTPSAHAEPPAPACAEAFDDDAVPNLRPSPRYGLVLALIGAAALAIGALTAMLVHRVDLDLPRTEQPATTEVPARPPAPVVISDLPEAEPTTGP